MKKIISGKLYNTETAEVVGLDSYSNPRDFHYWQEILYRKKTGEYFLFGEGGPASKYRVSIGVNQWLGGESILPLDIEAAKEWASFHLDVDDYVAEFGNVEE